MTGKRAERTKHDFQCSICSSAIGQASCLICTNRRQLTPFLLLNQPNIAQQLEILMRALGL